MPRHVCRRRDDVVECSVEDEALRAVTIEKGRTEFPLEAAIRKRRTDDGKSPVERERLAKAIERYVLGSEPLPLPPYALSALENVDGAVCVRASHVYTATRPV